MPSSFSTLLRKARAFMLPAVAMTAVFGGRAEAAAPKAPTDLTLATTYSFAPPNTGTARYYRLGWKDNSLDESGFRIEVRFGNAGPFNFVDTVSPNSTEYVTRDFDFGLNTLVQFRVVAFKFNGSKTESGTSATIEQTVESGSANLNAPSNFRVEQVNDGVLRFSWKDRSSSELYYQVFYKKQVESNDAYAPLNNPSTTFNESLLPFDNKQDTAVTDRTSVLFKHNLSPGESYTFRLRATRVTNGTGSEAPSNNHSAAVDVESYPLIDGQTAAYYTVPRPNPPNGLTGAPVDEQTIRLQWNDNSFNETAYEISYRAVGDDTWSNEDTSNPRFLTVASNTTSYTFTVGAGASMEWRVRAIPPTTDLEVEDTDYSNAHTIIMDFLPPQGLTATTSGLSATVDLTWQDTAKGESGYEVRVRPVNGTTPSEWFYAQASTMPADSTRLSVSGYLDAEGRYLSLLGQAVSKTPLTPNVEYEFYVEAVSSFGTSDPTNIARAYARHGFDLNGVETEEDVYIRSRPYQGGKVGEELTYNLVVTDPSNVLSFEVASLPAGLEFVPETRKIVGAPEQAGVFTASVTVHYADAQSATMPVVFRIVKADAEPAVAASLPAITVGTGSQQTMTLMDKFSDADSEKAVRLVTTKGNIDILLYPSVAPETVANFLGYVNNNAYDGVIFHRSISGPMPADESVTVGYILQGGGYVPSASPNYFSSISERPSPKNEPGLSNQRGTLAYAKAGDHPDSATHDFFFNLSDNDNVITALNDLDGLNSGFTVFARVAGDGMDVVDGIAALPVGGYGYNSGNSVYLDGQLLNSGSRQKALFGDMPMNVTGSTPPASMDINKTVQIISAREVLPLQYEVANSNPAAVRAWITDTVINEVRQGVLRVQGLDAGSATLTVTARDRDNHEVSQTVTVNVVKGYRAPVITKQPVSVAALPGKKARLSVTATGTDLLYQWRKNGTPLENANDKILNFDAVTEDDSGDYDVLVSNDAETVTSQVARVDLRTAPAIAENGHPEDKIVEVGSPLELTGIATGAPVPAITWLRSGRTVAKQKEQTLLIPAAQVADGGAYVMRAKNVAGTAETSPATIIVVDKSSRLLVSLPNRTVKLQAQASGPDLKYQWRYEGNDLHDDGEHFSGTNGPTLTIKKAQVGHTGEYTCFVRNVEKDMETETGPWVLNFTGAAPVISSAMTLDDAYVGIDYDFTIPGGGAANNSISTFSVSGLPKGLTVDAATGRITGRAQTAGQYVLKVTARNPKGSATVTGIPMNVYPMPEAVVGPFIGQIGSSTVFNNNKGGRIDLNVTQTGAISGKLFQGKETLSFTGVMSQNPQSVYATGVATVKRKNGLPPLTILLNSVALSGYGVSGDISGIITDGIDSVQFAAYRKQYDSAKGRISPYVGRHHMSLKLNAAAADEEDDPSLTPEGTGYLVAVLSSSGVVKVTGKLADGTSVTSSSFLGGQQQFLIYQSLYKHTGSIVGVGGLVYLDQITVSNVPVNRFRVEGTLGWSKDLQTSTKDRTYRAGFGPLQIDMLGMTYVAPPEGSPPMDLPKQTGNAAITFTGGGIEESDTDPDVSPITLGGSRLVPAGVQDEAGLTFSSSRITGLFNGKFTLQSAAEPKRAVKYSGLIIQRIPKIDYEDSTVEDIPAVDAAGVGYFLLNQLPSNETEPPTTLKNSPILSGRVDLQPMPVLITEQPQGQQVNPGTDVDFSVTATANQTLTYQWRKNGVNISGATAAEYSLEEVTENDEATYDVVIKTPYSTRISDPAFLSVNDNILNVTISRVPAANPVVLSEGTQVVFTAVHDGTGPFTYQWSKGNVELDGSGNTYTIGAVTEDSAGEYKVRVTSTLTGSTKTSSPNTLEVADPITFVTISRSPPGVIPYNGSVTFSVTDVDSSGPYTYQWYKVVNDTDVLIPTETGASYVMPGVSGTDAGFYKVLVKNAITPGGILSNEVELQVTTQVTNVNLIRRDKPGNEYFKEGDSAVLSVSTQGQPPFTYTWQKDGQPIVDGPITASLTLTNLTEASQGLYTVLVGNASTEGGQVSNSVRLRFLAPVTSVALSVQPGLTPGIGDTVTFTAVPDVPPPYSDIQWYKDGSLIDDADGLEYSITSFGDTDYGAYSVRVGNEANDDPVSSNQITLDVPEEENPE